MIRRVLACALAPFCCLPAFAQSYTPKNILFKGDTGYSNAELLAAAGLKKGASLTQAEMNARTKQLMDSGLFQDVSFTFNGQDLIFQISPATVLVPVELENIPLINGADLDTRLRSRFPLYRGKVPAEGSFLEDVRHELEAALKEKGIEAQVIVAPYTDPKLVTITKEEFSISSPDVSVGAIHVEGASAEFFPLLSRAAARITGSAYSNQGSLNQIETALHNFYGERGYLGASFHITEGTATEGAAPVVDAAGVHIPYSVTVTEGAPYKLAAIHLAPNLIITQEAFDKESGLRAGEPVSLLKLRGGVEYVVRQYHNQGHMLAQVHAEPTLDVAAGTASYTITAEPGPVFTMGALRVVNVQDDLHDALLAAWKIPAGAVFDESQLRNLAVAQNLTLELRHALSVANIRSILKLHEDIHTVDVELTLIRKPL